MSAVSFDQATISWLHFFNHACSSPAFLGGEWNAFPNLIFYRGWSPGIGLQKSLNSEELWMQRDFREVTDAECGEDVWQLLEALLTHQSHEWDRFCG